MRKLLNTLYISSEDLYLSLDNHNVVVRDKEGQTVQKTPLHMLEAIVSFSRRGISIPLMAKCSEEGIPIFLLSEQGSLIATVQMPSRGNILLRKAQYRLADDHAGTLLMASAFVEGKIRNMRHLVDRFLWDHPGCDGEAFLRNQRERLDVQADQLDAIHDLNVLRGLEGDASAVYFQCLSHMLLDKHGAFSFHGRNKRPPLDPINAMLSFAYTLLTNECAAALETVGLDASAGFLHQDHPGRKSLACDLVEELRSTLADRFVIQMVNKRVVTLKMFDHGEDGAVYLNREGRKVFLYHWQRQKAEEVMHHVLLEKIPFGLIPYAQATLLARYIRGDIPRYIPFFRR